MLLKDFIKILSKVKEKNTCDVEFWLGETELDLKEMGQFGISKTVTIHFKKLGKTVMKPITNPTLIKKLQGSVRKQMEAEVKPSKRSKKS